MRVSALVSLLATVAGTAIATDDGSPVTGELGNATVVEDNPPGVVYRAVLPDTAFYKEATYNNNNGSVKGEIVAVADPSGIGVIFKVRFSNLPKEGGPFPYHIHVNPVPDSGNCTQTLAHLDPYIRGETPPCDRQVPQTCQTGDLSGKHGLVESDPFEARYKDEFASTTEGIGAFFGNRSFVIHFANKTRISCANFEQVYNSNPSFVSEIVTSTSACPANATAATVFATAGVATTTQATTQATAKPTQTTVTVSGGSQARVGSAGFALVFAALAMFML